MVKKFFSCLFHILCQRINHVIGKCSKGNKKKKKERPIRKKRENNKKKKRKKDRKEEKKRLDLVQPKGYVIRSLKGSCLQTDI
jgi:hypothetical protein